MINLRYNFGSKVFGIFVLALGLCLSAVPSAFSQTNKSGGTNDAKKDESVFKRDPFWPVGYVPENLKKAAVENDQIVTAPAVNNNWNEAMKKVVINGVSSRSDDEFFAVINGQVKSVGDTVTLNHEGTVYTWAVDSINPPGSVKLRRVSAQ
jgi:hypothetical protein